jgi:hypothetical protein
MNRNWLVCAVLTFLLSGSAVAQTLILDESAQWRRYYRFGADRVSPAAMKTEAGKILDAATMDRAKKDAEARLDKSGPDNFAVFRP